MSLKRSSFAAKVLTAVRRIPFGRVATYGDVAAMAGKPRASRAVGNVMRECSDSSVPAHRVIAAGGKVGGYAGDIGRKRSALIAEGLEVSKSTVRDFKKKRFTKARRSHRH